MSEEKKYPIAEIFTSPQGEGVHTGVLMTFVRLAGCTVGKPFPKARYEQLPHCKFECKGGDPDMGHGPNCSYAKSLNNFLPIYTEQCTTFDGRKFECDTDYRVHERLTSDEIIARVHKDTKNVCLTGGEPMMHDLVPLLYEFNHAGIHVHMETSGTIPLHKAFRGGDVEAPPSWVEEGLWITVSPKFGVLEEMADRADELKLLVDKDFDITTVPSFLMRHKTIYIQPINFENRVNEENLKRCLALQLEYPNLRVSTQSHKFWNVR